MSTITDNCLFFIQKTEINLTASEILEISSKPPLRMRGWGSSWISENQEHLYARSLKTSRRKPQRMEYTRYSLQKTIFGGLFGC
jgi:hypothetical protein